MTVYDFDKMLAWKNAEGRVEVAGGFVCSYIKYWLGS